MDKACIDCGVGISKRATRCKTCSAYQRWRDARPADYTPPTCKTCGWEITGRSKARAVYCDIKCKFADPEMRAKMGPPKRRVAKTCIGCGVEFEVSISTADRYNYCTRDCSTEHRGRAAACRRCGAEFRHGRTQNRSHCSEACRRPPIVIDCDHCGTSFRIVPSAASRRRYCSRRCYVASDAETSIERIVRQRLEAMAIAHQPQAQVGPWVVDFLVDRRLVIEADGSYWHSFRPENDRRKTTDLIDRGYDVWRLPEPEIIALGFPALFERRLVDYETANGEFPRLTPDELATLRDEDGVISGHSKRALANGDAVQLILNL